MRHYPIIYRTSFIYAADCVCSLAIISVNSRNVYCMSQFEFGSHIRFAGSMVSFKIPIGINYTFPLIRFYVMILQMDKVKLKSLKLETIPLDMPDQPTMTTC